MFATGSCGNNVLLRSQRILGYRVFSVDKNKYRKLTHKCFFVSFSYIFKIHYVRVDFYGCSLVLQQPCLLSTKIFFICTITWKLVRFTRGTTNFGIKIHNPFFYKNRDVKLVLIKYYLFDFRN